MKDNYDSVNEQLLTVQIFKNLRNLLATFFKTYCA